MALQSAGVESKEKNMSSVTTSSGTGTAGMVGKFAWGPAFRVTQVTGEPDLVSIFGESNDYTYASFMVANNFLKYGNDLRLVRVVDESTAKNASPLCNAINYKIGDDSHSGYAVGNTFEVMFGSDTVTSEDVGRVTEVGLNGTVRKVYIPSTEITSDMKERGETDLSGYSVNFITTAGSGVRITLELITDSMIYFPNNDFAAEQFADSTDGAYRDVISKLGMKTLSAKYCGAYGDDIKVYIVNKADYDESITPSIGNTSTGNVTLAEYPTGIEETINVKSYFSFGPATDNQYAVLVKLGDAIVENFIISTNPSDIDVNGETIFIDNFFDNDGSQYIYGTTDSWSTNSGIYNLRGGFDSEVQIDDWDKGWDEFSDPESLYINLLIAGNVADEDEETASTVQKYAQSIGDSRSDCVVFASPPKSLVINKTTVQAVDNMVAWRNGIDSKGKTVDNNFNVSSTYVFIDGNYKYQFDKYSNRNRWVPFAGDIAGLCVYTDQVANPWESPAGLTRGQIKNVIKVAVNTKRAHRNRMYEAQINPILTLTGQGTVLYGDKTATSQASAFDRINVRRLFNMIEKAISDSSQFNLFEINDDYTRSSFKSEVDSYMDNIRSLGGVYDFRVICDTTNNTPQVIDSHQFIGTIYVKPARSINFITLNFVATSTGANFVAMLG